MKKKPSWNRVVIPLFVILKKLETKLALNIDLKSLVIALELLINHLWELAKPIKTQMSIIESGFT